MTSRLLARLAPCLLPAAFAAFSSAQDARAGDAPAAPPTVAVPKASGLALDGKPSEEAWAKAAAIPADAAAGVPASVKVLVADGRLWLAVETLEDPGFPIGVTLKVAPEGAASAADAVSLAYKPLDPRSPRYEVLGPRGGGRKTYRFAATSDLSRGGAWTLEASLPVADLALAKPDAPLRLAAAVSLRTPNRTASAPAGALLAGPATFALLTPPEGGWASTEGPPADDAAIAAEDAADQARMDAWADYKKAASQPFASLAAARAALLPPIDRAIAARKDLATLYWQRAMLLSQLEDEPAARGSLEQAIALVPHFREVSWALDLLRILKFLDAPDLPNSDYAAAYARIAADAKRFGPDADSPKFLEGYLRYREGDFEKAVPLLQDVVARHPEVPLLKAIADAAGDFAKALGLELGFRKDDAAKDDLPRAKITTPKGVIMIELWEDDCPNTVANFVWLARGKWFDGLAFHRVVPFFVIQGGDPYSKTPGHERVGQGGPGWLIKTEKGKRGRRALRGVVGMANSGPDTEGSQFFVMTGSDRNLDEGYSLFGRVIEGLDVADKIGKDDAIVSIEIVRARDHEYRPVTTTGKPAPPPAK